MLGAALRWKCDKIAQVDRTEPLLTRWAALKSKISKKYKKRHEVAHSDIVQQNTDGNNVVSLAPFSTLSKAIIGYKTLGLSELQERRRQFNELSGEISSFRAAMLAVLSPSP
jgi:hypothetical protein